MFHIFHAWSKWRIRAEVPVWDNFNAFRKERVAGNQPKTLMNTTTGRDYFPDPTYRLVGKAIEQQRQCATCGKTEIDFKVVVC